MYLAQSDEPRAGSSEAILLASLVRAAALSRCTSAASSSEAHVDQSSSTHPRCRIESAARRWCVPGQQTASGPRSAHDMSLETPPLGTASRNICVARKRSASIRQSSAGSCAAAASRSPPPPWGARLRQTSSGGKAWSARAVRQETRGGGAQRHTSSARLKFGAHAVERSQQRRSSSLAAAAASSPAPQPSFCACRGLRHDSCSSSRTCCQFDAPAAPSGQARPCASKA
mmetsp:Transcript_9364/g.30565  ORF Transcript_9364/g.30565 Transcript_9364/m.30565 type:complete len:229 (+) Transcript_9364:886-1572(+)